MALEVYVNAGSEISAIIEWPTLKLVDVLTKEKSTLSFTVKETPGNVASIPVIGDQIDLFDGATHLFGGEVTDSENVVEGGILIGHQVQCIDWGFRLDSQLVVKTYVDMDPRDIVLDIMANFTDGTFTTTNVQPGNFHLASISFNYEPVSRALQRLAQTIGWDWYVDPDMDLHFFLLETAVAPYQVDDTGGNLEWPTLDILSDITNIKNSVFVIGGTYTKNFTALTTPDLYETDGTKDTFVLAYPYLHDPSLDVPVLITVLLDSTPQTVGIDGQVTNPASVDVLYNRDEKFVRFTAGAPASGHTVTVYGDAIIPIQAHVTNDASILSYGEKQSVIVDTQIKTTNEALSRARAEIAQYSDPVYTARFRTLQTGLQIGMQLTVNSVKFNFNRVLTVKRIMARCYGPLQLEYEVEAISTDQVSFVDIMALLLQRENNDNPVDPSTVLQVIKSVSESLTLSDVIAATSATPPYRWGPTTPTVRWGFWRWG